MATANAKVFATLAVFLAATIAAFQALVIYPYVKQVNLRLIDPCSMTAFIAWYLFVFNQWLLVALSNYCFSGLTIRQYLVLSIFLIAIP